MNTVTTALTAIIAVGLVSGCMTPPEQRVSTSAAPREQHQPAAQDWSSCSRIIDKQKTGPEVDKAKARLEELAFQPGNSDALYAFVSRVKESPRHREATANFEKYLLDTLNNFTANNSSNIKRSDSVPGKPVFGIGATVTLNGSFTKEQMRIYGFYSWPLSPLRVQQGMNSIQILSGEGIILNYQDGFAYVRGCAFIK